MTPCLSSLFFRSFFTLSRSSSSSSASKMAAEAGLARERVRAAKQAARPSRLPRVTAAPGAVDAFLHGNGTTPLVAVVVTAAIVVAIGSDRNGGRNADADFS